VKTRDQLCAEIELRLVEGRPAADAPEVIAHLRSCLRCFRTATELRQVPQLAALLREGEESQPDPGPLFWARFPGTVADAWERRQQTAAASAVPLWRRVGGWFRLPFPAALAGAAAAAVLVLALVQRTPAPQATAPIPAHLPAAPAPEAITDEEGTASLLGEEDPLDVLDLADARLVARMTDRESIDIPAMDEGADLGPSPAEELELLEADDLRAVAQALRGRGQI
jgi:anti-sigma-K factor RskA